MSHGTVYVLELENGKYYVGHTKDVNLSRILEHGNTQKSAMWTQQHKPLRIMRMIPGSTCDEDRMTIHAMEVFGWRNVRGGKWTRTQMENPPQELVRNGLLTNEICTRCTRYGHNVKICLWQVEPDGDVIFSE